MAPAIRSLVKVALLGLGWGVLGPLAGVLADDPSTIWEVIIGDGQQQLNRFNTTMLLPPTMHHGDGYVTIDVKAHDNHSKLVYGLAKVEDQTWTVQDGFCCRPTELQDRYDISEALANDSVRWGMVRQENGWAVETAITGRQTHRSSHFYPWDYLLGERNQSVITFSIAAWQGGAWDMGPILFSDIDYEYEGSEVVCQNGITGLGLNWTMAGNASTAGAQNSTTVCHIDELVLINPLPDARMNFSVGEVSPGTFVAGASDSAAAAAVSLAEAAVATISAEPSQALPTDLLNDDATPPTATPVPS